MICVLYDPEDAYCLIATVDDKGICRGTHEATSSTLPSSAYWISADAAQQLTYDSLNFIDEEAPILFTDYLESWGNHELLVLYDTKFPLVIHHPELFV